MSKHYSFRTLIDSYIKDFSRKNIFKNMQENRLKLLLVIILLLIFLLYGGFDFLHTYPKKQAKIITKQIISTVDKYTKKKLEKLYDVLSSKNSVELKEFAKTLQSSLKSGENISNNIVEITKKNPNVTDKRTPEEKEKARLELLEKIKNILETITKNENNQGDILQKIENILSKTNETIGNQNIEQNLTIPIGNLIDNQLKPFVEDTINKVKETGDNFVSGLSGNLVSGTFASIKNIPGKIFGNAKENPPTSGANTKTTDKEINNAITKFNEIQAEYQHIFSKYQQEGYDDLLIFSIIYLNSKDNTNFFPKNTNVQNILINKFKEYKETNVDFNYKIINFNNEPFSVLFYKNKDNAPVVSIFKTIKDKTITDDYTEELVKNDAVHIILNIDKSYNIDPMNRVISKISDIIVDFTDVNEYKNLIILKYLFFFITNTHIYTKYFDAYTDYCNTFFKYKKYNFKNINLIIKKLYVVTEYNLTLYSLSKNNEPAKRVLIGDNIFSFLNSNTLFFDDSRGSDGMILKENIFKNNDVVMSNYLSDKKILLSNDNRIHNRLFDAIENYFKSNGREENNFGTLKKRTSRRTKRTKKTSKRTKRTKRSKKFLKKYVK